MNRSKTLRAPKLDIPRMLKSGSVLDAMLDDFFAQGGTQRDLVQQINAAYTKAGSSWELAHGDSNWERLLSKVEDFSECVVPVLAESIKNCDMDTFRHALARGAHLELCSPNIAPAIVMAARESVQQVGSINSDGRFELDQTLELAAERQRAIARKQLGLLIDAGADLDFTDRDGATALIECSAGIDPNGVRVLLTSGASVNDRGADGVTALHSALCHRFIEPQTDALCRARLEVVQLLLEHGAKPNARTFNGYTPLHLFASQRPQISKEWALQFVNVMLAAGARLDLRNWRGHTPLLDTVANGGRGTDLTIADVLLEVGADLEAKDWGGSGFEKIGNPDVRRAARSLLTARNIGQAMGEGSDVAESEPSRSAGFAL